MRITTRLRAFSTVTIAALIVLLPVLIWSLIEFRSAKIDFALADAIKDNAFERAAFRDRYFLYREETMRVQWDSSKETADRLFLQAAAQFDGKENQLILEKLRRNIGDSADIFYRIVNNTEVLKTASGNRHVYDELDKRLSSQLLLKDAAIRNSVIDLENLSSQRIEQTYVYLTIAIGLFAVLLAIAAIFSSIQLGRIIRKRLALLHDGAKIIADGNLDFRIQPHGTDEFAELAISINAVTDKLQAFTRQLETEISAHKQMASALRDNEERLQMVLSGAEMATWDWHIPSGSLVFNARWAEMQGYVLEELPPRVESWETRVFPDDMAQVREKLERHFKGETPVYESEHRVRHKDGHYIWVQGRGRVVEWDEAGNPVRAVGIALDISERKRIEEELHQMNETLERRVQEETAKNMKQERLLIQQSRMAAMGEMIGNIAHQWRQPINALTILLSNIKDAYEYKELDKEYLDKAVFTGQDLIQKMSRTIDDFRNFFKPNKEKQHFQISASVDDAIKLVDHSFKNNNIEIFHDTTTGACTAIGYPNEFAQVVLNVLTNAKEAIAARKIAGEIHIKVKRDGNQTLTVTVRDNGGGIPADILGKIFDPYFTTKEKGTGIGLYMSKQIMEHMDGGIVVNNIEGGAEVLMTLPCSENFMA